MAPYVVCLTGPECTGKTQLATEMAVRYGTVFVPEYAREYARMNPRELGPDDVEPIARGQIALTEEVRPGANRILILDTDLISTVVYARYYYGSCPQWIESEARARRADLYLLLDVDTPWEDDGIRDAAQDRDGIFTMFVRVLSEFGVTPEVVGGSWDERRRRTSDLIAAAAG